MKKIKNGFTLIELLVVVLIVGILAAIAVSQYRFAVDKILLQEAVLVARDLYRANQRRQMETGEKILVLWHDLDIEPPAGFVLQENGHYLKGTNRTNKIEVIKINKDIIYIYIWPRGNDLNLELQSQPPYRGLQCMAHGLSYSKKLCASLGPDRYIFR